MASGKSVVAVLIAATIAMTLFNPLAGAVNDNTGTQTVTNETVTADVGAYVELSGYDIIESSETVYGYNETSGDYETATEGTDYEMGYENGSIKALSGSTLIDDGENVKVTYDYKATSGTTTTVLNLVPLFAALIILVALATRVQSKV